MTKKESNIKMWAVMAALALMIVFSGVQAMELQSLKEKVNTGLDGLSTVQVGNTTSKATNLKSNLESLPTMVGGC